MAYIIKTILYTIVYTVMIRPMLNVLKGYISYMVFFETKHRQF